MRDQTLERGLYGKDVIDLADEMLDEARMKYIGRRLKKLEGTWLDRGKTKLREEQEQIRFRVNARNTPEYRDRITRLMKDPSGLISGKGEPQREPQDLFFDARPKARRVRALHGYDPTGDVWVSEQTFVLPTHHS